GLDHAECRDETADPTRVLPGTAEVEHGGGREYEDLQTQRERRCVPQRESHFWRGIAEQRQIVSVYEQVEKPVRRDGTRRGQGGSGRSAERAGDLDRRENHSGPCERRQETVRVRHEVQVERV